MYNNKVITIIMDFKNYIFVITFRIRSNIIITFIPKIVSTKYNSAGTKVINIVKKGTFGLVLLNGTTVFWLYYTIYNQ